MLSDPIDLDLIMTVLDCLIDTAERTTDLDGVYDDDTGQYASWPEVYEAYSLVSLALGENKRLKIAKSSLSLMYENVRDELREVSNDDG